MPSTSAPQWFVAIAYLMLIAMLAKAVATVVLARSYHRGQSWIAAKSEQRLTVTVVVPAYNEELGLTSCLSSLERQTHPYLDVLVVNDGSTDRTAEVATQLIANMRVPARVLTKDNGGKASALNHGLVNSTSDVLVCVDADSVLAPDAVARLVEGFADPAVGAVGGMVKVANRRSALGGQQAIEYISGLALQRAAFARCSSIQVLSGAISAFRRSALTQVGGYSSDTIVEDFDVTVAVQQAGHRAILHPHALAYTEGPLTLADLVRQRHRWTFGGFQVLTKYRQVLFTRKIGNLSAWGLPYFLLFPWIDVAVSAMLLGTLALVLLGGSLVDFIVVFAALSLISAGLNAYALRLSGDHPALMGWGLLQNVFYAHVLTFATARAGAHYVLGKDARWHKLQRAGSAIAGDAIVIDLRDAPVPLPTPATAVAMHAPARPLATGRDSARRYTSVRAHAEMPLNRPHRVRAGTAAVSDTESVASVAE